MNNLQLKAKLAGIKNIIFDLGGVIVGIDYMRTQLAFESLGIVNFGQLYSQAAQTGIFDDFEKGLMSPAIFREALRKFTPNLRLTDTEIDNAWNKMLLDIPAYRLGVIKGLKSSFRTFLLSNTNEVHIACFHGMLNKQYGLNDLSDYFEQVYYSHNVHMRKPDADIFEFVLNQNQLKAGETLFIDDTIRHTEGAKAVGIQAIHISSPDVLKELYNVLAEYAL